MYETIYHRPSSVDEAAALFAKGSESKYLAGGHTLIPVMKQRLAAPSDVIDLGKIKELIGIEPTGDGIMIKAATTHYDVASSGTVQKAIPALAFLASLITERSSSFVRASSCASSTSERRPSGRGRQRSRVATPRRSCSRAS